MDVLDVVIGVNDFVTRQICLSEFSFYEGSFEDVAALARQSWHLRKPGYRDGVVTVPVPTKGFYSGIVQLNEGDKLCGEFKARRPGETPRKSVQAAGRAKMPAEAVELVLYSSKVLAEDGENCLPPSDGNWELISINASPVEGDQPIEPSVLLANHFGQDGGTATNMTDAELVAQLKVSVEFWADKVNASAD